MHNITKNKINEWNKRTHFFFKFELFQVFKSALLVVVRGFHIRAAYIYIEVARVFFRNHEAVCDEGQISATIQAVKMPN